MATEIFKFVIWGAAGHAKVLTEIICINHGIVLALFDNSPIPKSPLPDVPVFLGRDGYDTWLRKHSDRSDLAAVAAIGGARGVDRRELLTLFRSSGLATPSLVHPSSHISNTAIVGASCHILASAVLGVEAILGEACILNTKASVDHECILGDGVHVAPGATLCGCVTVGDHTFIGANAVVLPRVRIGSNAIIGAGAVVNRDVPDNVVTFGNPARIVKRPSHA